MKRFQIWWLKFCCFLIGYNFYILSNCSEVSTQKVKKYTAALLIVSTIWAFVGFCFCNTYMKIGISGSIIGALISVFIIIQIERQILLSGKTNIGLKITRIGLALLMSVIGSLIVDQIIFKDDIDKTKMASNQDQVNLLMPGRTKQISDQIANLNSALQKKENERLELLDDINKNPTKQIVEITSGNTPVTKTSLDSANRLITNTILTRTLTKSVKTIPNPKVDQLQPIDNQLKLLNDQKIAKENVLLGLKALLEKEVGSKIGFLDELGIMFTILQKSAIAATVYIIWLMFFLLLELLILIAKSNESESDYDKTIQKQMDIHLRKIELL